MILPHLSLPGLGQVLPVVLAPLSGLTDAPFRRLVESYGVGWTVSEMVASDALRRGKSEAVRRTRPTGLGHHVVQLAGFDPYWMSEAARQLEDEGVAMIDINMGCPAKRVSGRLCGAGLMRDLDQAVRLIAALCQAVRVPISVKMRLGWDHQSLNAPELARRAEAEGASLVTVHGRTRSEFYKGKADWTAIRSVVEAVTIPVLANGDLLKENDVAVMVAESGAQGVMIGRGALGRPWFLQQVADTLAGNPSEGVPGLTQQREGLLALYREGLALYGRQQGVKHLRAHIEAALAIGWGGVVPSSYRKAILQNENPEEVEVRLFDFYNACGDRKERKNVMPCHA